MTEKTIHQGRNIKRFREMLGMKQEALALEMGDDWTQRRVSLLEAKDVIEPDVLEQVAKALKIPAEAIRSFDEQTAINIIANTVTNYDNGSLFNFQPTFNPLSKYIEQVEKMKNYTRLCSRKKMKR